MRPPVDEPRIRALAMELGRVARGPVRIYLTGGSTAVIEGWREATVDVDPSAFRRKLEAVLG